VDEIQKLDTAARQSKHSADLLRKSLGDIGKEIAKKKKANEAIDDLVVQKNKLEEEIKVLEAEFERLDKELLHKINTVGNIVHESVPVSKNEDDNHIHKTWKPEGALEKGAEGLFHHFELLEAIGGYDSKKGSDVAGHRGYFLKGWGFKLNQAIISYGIDFLEKRLYTPIQPPFFMSKDVMAKTAQLSEFDEMLYKLHGDTPAEEKYLIATSEQPISALHHDDWLEEKDLPIRYAGLSTCFRKEAGTLRDARGIFRVHQFEKVEQFCITEPEKSWEMQEEMLKASEDFYQSLGIGYQVVVIVSGALNNAASKKYDLEGFFPAFGGFRELVSCSNCTDYQSRSLEIRCGFKKKGDTTKKYVHMLNSTLCATTRTICAILENHQTKDGIRIPEVLRSYLGGKEFIPFAHPPKRDKETK